MKKKQIDIILRNQHDFFEKGVTLDISFRIRALQRLKACIKRNENAIHRALQKDLGLPFDQCGGKTATRYTYTVLNYPDIPQGVQANLFVCGDQVIAGDITSLGQNGFRRSLQFPEQ